MADNEEIPAREKGETNEAYINRLKETLFQKPKEKNAAFNARIRNIVAKQKAKEAEIEAKKKEAFDKMIAEAKRLFQIAPPGAEGNVVRNAAIAALKATGFNASDYEGHAATIKQRREFAAAEDARRRQEAEERARAAAKEAAEEKAAYDELVKLYGSKLSADTAIGIYGSIWYWPRSRTELYRGLIAKRKEDLANPMTDEQRREMERRIKEENDRRAARKAARKAAEQGVAQGAYSDRTPAAAAPAAPAMYPILEVPVTASSKNIKKAYRKKALIHHPNQGGIKEAFQALQEEYGKALAKALINEGAEGGRRRTHRSKTTKRMTRRRS